MDCSTPGFPVPHHFPEFAQVHAHWISDAIQPSHLLLPSSPPALSLLRQYLLLGRAVRFTAALSLGAGHAAPALVCQLILPALPHPSHTPTSHPLITKACVNLVTGHRGERCLRDFNCGPGLCCAHHYRTKICKPVLLEGHVCSRRGHNDNTHVLDIFQRCNCAPGLVCQSQAAQNPLHTRLHVCQNA